MSTSRSLRTTSSHTGGVNQQTASQMWPHVFMAMFGAGWAIAFDVGFRLYVAELVAVVGLLVIRWPTIFKRYPALRKIIGVYAVWIVAIALSDTINETPIFNSLRNIATPLLGGISLVFATIVLDRNPKSLATFLLVIGIAKGIMGEPAYGETFADRSLSWETIQSDTNFFKVRVDPFLTPLILLLTYWLSGDTLRRPLTVFALASIGYMALDARSSGLVFVVSFLILACVNAKYRPSTAQIAAAIIISLGIGYAGYIAYANYTITYNPSGHNGQQLQRMANPYNPVELMMQGRPDWFAIPQAIIERPVLGWGSWAEDTTGRFASLRSERSGLNDFDQFQSSERINYIPAHSLIGSAWVWSGILAAAAMFLLYNIAWRLAINLQQVNREFIPVFVYSFVMLNWHYFFSPPQLVRLYFPIAVATLVVLGTIRQRIPNHRKDLHR